MEGLWGQEMSTWNWLARVDPAISRVVSPAIPKVHESHKPASKMRTALLEGPKYRDVRYVDNVEFLTWAYNPHVCTCKPTDWSRGSYAVYAHVWVRFQQASVELLHMQGGWCRSPKQVRGSHGNHHPCASRSRLSLSIPVIPNHPNYQDTGYLGCLHSES